MVQLKTDKGMEVGMKEKQANELLIEALHDNECEAAIMMTMRKDGTGMSLKNGQVRYMIRFLIHFLEDREIYPFSRLAVALYLRNHIQDLADILRLIDDDGDLDQLLDKHIYDTQETA